MIYILTGDIRTGKTTALLNWINNRKDVDGLLCPDDENGKRYFLNIKTKEHFNLEVHQDYDMEIVEIGPFQFSKAAFDKANNFLMSSTSEMENRYLIVDELGKLELKNKGLHLAAEQLIPHYMLNVKYDLILVVRESLLDEIIRHYSISKYSLLKIEDIERIA